MVLALLLYKDGIAYRVSIFKIDVEMEIMRKAWKTQARRILLG
jgi:hypothetical protein